MRIALQPAFVLHRRPYRDTSLLLEAFSRDHGRIGLIARGARAPRARGGGTGGLLQALTPLTVSWSGSGELPTLTAVEARAPALLLHGERLLCALYLNELLLRLCTRFDPHPELFEAYQQALRQLAPPAAPPALPLRLFEKRLLEQLGYGLQLRAAADGRPIDADALYRYRVDQGPQRLDGEAGAVGERPAGYAAASTDTDTDADGIRCSGRALLALAAERLDDPALCREVRPLLRAALDAQLGGRSLQTRQLLSDYRRRRRAAGLPPDGAASTTTPTTAYTNTYTNAVADDGADVV